MSSKHVGRKQVLYRVLVDELAGALRRVTPHVVRDGHDARGPVGVHEAVVVAELVFVLVTGTWTLERNVRYPLDNNHPLPTPLQAD